MKVRNMTSNRSGKEVANQFIITDKGKEVFQSYRTIIAIIENGKITLDRDKWNCSVTTGKYRNLFLGEGKKETETKIKTGEYKLKNLN